METALSIACVLIVALVVSPAFLKLWRERPNGYRLKLFCLTLILFLVAAIPFLFKWLPAGVQAPAAGAFGVALFLFGAVFGVLVLRQWSQDEIENSPRPRKKGEEDLVREAGAAAVWLRVAMKLLVFLVVAVVLCLAVIFLEEWFS